MASLNQLVSEISQIVGQPNNYALRENIRLSVIHTRNELIRHSYSQHGYLDKGLQYRYCVSLQNVKDGELKTEELPDDIVCTDITTIKRTCQKVPRPVRLTNNLPFHRVSTRGFKTNIEIPFVKETAARFMSSVPGFCGMDSYDYINDYIYVFPTSANSRINGLNKIVIEAAFEHPTNVAILNGDGPEFDFIADDNEWYLPEDMIGMIKDIIVKRDLLNNVRENNEIEKDKMF